MEKLCESVGWDEVDGHRVEEKEGLGEREKEGEDVKDGVPDVQALPPPPRTPPTPAPPAPGGLRVVVSVKASRPVGVRSGEREPPPPPPLPPPRGDGVGMAEEEGSEGVGEKAPEGVAEVVRRTEMVGVPGEGEGVKVEET